MLISFSPCRMDAELKGSRAGDKLTINRKAFDFSRLIEGATLPAEAVDSEFVVGEVMRKDGRVHLTLLLPHGQNPPAEIAFPKPLIDPPDGELPIPQMPAKAEEEA